MLIIKKVGHPWPRTTPEAKCRVPTSLDF